MKLNRHDVNWQVVFAVCYQKFSIKFHLIMQKNKIKIKLQNQPISLITKGFTISLWPANFIISIANTWIFLLKRVLTVADYGTPPLILDSSVEDNFLFPELVLSNKLNYLQISKRVQSWRHSSMRAWLIGYQLIGY